MSEPKTKPTEASVEAFLARLPEARRRDCETLVRLMREATGADPVMWGSSIVGFGRYKHRYGNGREGEWPLIGFSPRKNDLTLYIVPGFARFEQLLSGLGRHKTGKSCLYIRNLNQVELPVLEALIGESVRAMSRQRVDR